MADVQCAGCGAQVEAGVVVCPTCGANPKTGGEPVSADGDLGGRALGFGLGGLAASLLLHGLLLFWIGPVLSIAGLYYGVTSLSARSGPDQSRGKAWTGVVCAAIGLVPALLTLVWLLMKSAGG
jgi:hypothetical protein